MCHDHSPTRIALWAFFPAIAPLERLQPVRTLRRAQDEVYWEMAFKRTSP